MLVKGATDLLAQIGVRPSVGKVMNQELNMFSSKRGHKNAVSVLDI